MVYYVGILDGSGDVWGVRIPDCPGAYGAGATPDAAVASAIAGLTTWARAALQDGEDLPQARSAASLEQEIGTGETAVRLPLLV